MPHKEKQNNFAFLILSYKSDDLTLRLAESIRTFDIDSTIVVVDNSGENELLKSQLALLCNTHLIISGGNLGYAGGNNVGLKYLSQKGDVKFVFICNPDIKIDKTSIETMKKTICEDRDISILGSRILDSKDNDQVSYWGSRTLIQDIVGDFSLLRFVSRLFKKTITIAQEAGSLLECDVVSGAFFLANLNILRTVNYFDGRTFLYCEERILAKRLDNIGAKRFVLMTATCHHGGSVTINVKFSTRLKRHFLLIRSRLVYYRYYSNLISFLSYGLFVPFSLIEKFLIDALVFLVGVFRK